uniref:Uncharacterized protein n=1 Tax=Arundo donax TaxID=35708 RepID=A0A0A9CVR7_ARUDO
MMFITLSFRLKCLVFGSFSNVSSPLGQIRSITIPILLYVTVSLSFGMSCATPVQYNNTTK